VKSNPCPTAAATSLSRLSTKVGWTVGALLLGVGGWIFPVVGGLRAAGEPDLPPALTPAQEAALGVPSPEVVPRLYIREYRVTGATRLPRVDVERAVYPFLGPGRTNDDVEGARAALEKAYRDRGYQTVGVQVPQQSGRRGIIVLQVVEQKVGRLLMRSRRERPRWRRERFRILRRCSVT
jgi:hemolysin activation/secretion protein